MTHNVVDNPGVLHFFSGHGPATPIGPCPHPCPHKAQSVIAYGPDFDHYELMVCDVEDGCNGSCRGWRVVSGVDDNSQRVRKWTHVGEETPLPDDNRDIILNEAP